jgi:hypothetical protein
MKLRKKIELRIIQINAEIEAKQNLIIELANNKKFYDLAGIMNHSRGLNVLFNRLLELEKLIERVPTCSVISPSENQSNEPANHN